MRASESWQNFWICSRKKKDDSDKAGELEVDLDPCRYRPKRGIAIGVEKSRRKMIAAPAKRSTTPVVVL
jgi:hypothetical protein